LRLCEVHCVETFFAVLYCVTSGRMTHRREDEGEGLPISRHFSRDQSPSSLSSSKFKPLNRVVGSGEIVDIIVVACFSQFSRSVPIRDTPDPGKTSSILLSSICSWNLLNYHEGILHPFSRSQAASDFQFLFMDLRMHVSLPS
jgi:hypothetical protein